MNMETLHLHYITNIVMMNSDGEVLTLK